MRGHWSEQDGSPIERRKLSNSRRKKDIKKNKVGNGNYSTAISNAEKTHADSRESSERTRDQANKSTGRMPWHQEPKKDVVNCEKPWGAVSKH